MPREGRVQGNIAYIVPVGARAFADGSPLPEGVYVRSRTSIQVDFYQGGKRCREPVPGIPYERSVREAGALRQAVLFAIDRGTYVRENFFSGARRQRTTAGPVNARMDALLDGWLRLKRGTIGENSHEDYTKIVECHLKSRFGELAASAVGLDALVSFRADLMDRGLSIKRIRNVLTPLRGALEMAVACQLITATPFRSLPPLKSVAFAQVRCLSRQGDGERFDEPLPRNLEVLRSEPSDIHPLTPRERDALLGCLAGQERNFFEFAVWSGLRTGELIALRWCDVDFEGRRVVVRQSQSRKVLKGPKTAAGIRWVELDDRGWGPLEAQLGFTGEERQRVFHNPRTGRPWAGDGVVRKRWAKAMSRAGVPYRRPYQLRHTYASTLLSEGRNPMFVAQQLGHKDWSMLVEVYGRWIPEVGRPLHQCQQNADELD